MSLQYCTNQELINELFSRSTFIGVLVASNHQHLRDDQIHDDYSLYTRIPTHDAIGLLNQITRKYNTDVQDLH